MRGMAMFEAGQIDAFASDRTLLLAMGLKTRIRRPSRSCREDLSFRTLRDRAAARGDDDMRSGRQFGARTDLHAARSIVEIF